jgi:polyhydroxyalkanoate synthesis regulator phasin
MATKDGFQKYLDAGIAFTALTRARAEELVHELVQSGEFQSDDARAKVEDLVDELIGMARKGREVLVAQVRHEVARQMDSAGITNLEDLAKQVASLIGRTAEAGRAATATDKSSKKATTKAKASGKTGASKSSATSTGASTAAKKKAATKAAAKKSPARKAAGTKAAATKTSAKKATAKKATAKRSPSAARPAD